MEPLTIAALAAIAAQTIGGIAKSVSASKQADQQRRDREYARQNMIGASQGAYDDIYQMFSPFAALAPQALEGIQQNFTVDPGQFTYEKTVRDFLDPSIAFQRDQAVKALEGSAAVKGNLLSGAAMKAMQDRAMQVGQTGYNSAVQQMMEDKSFAYRTYADDFARRQSEAIRAFEQANALLGASQWGVAGRADARQQLGNNIANAYGSSVGMPSSVGAGWGGFGNAMSNAGSAYNMLQLANYMNSQNASSTQAPMVSGGITPQLGGFTGQPDPRYAQNPFMQPQSFTPTHSSPVAGYQLFGGK